METVMYMVVRYVDNLPKYEYGVDDSYYLVGIFSDKALADAMKDFREAQAKHNGYGDIMSFEVKEVVLNKLYGEDNEIFLGGGYYIE